jgi:ubiquinone/menaquinone biosynthesis C-methylase UbiE
MLTGMGLYRDQVLPRLQDRLLDLGDTRAIRSRVCAGLAGDVVEIGFGSGLNLPHLPGTVTSLWAVEPSTVGRGLSTRRRERSAVPVVFAAGDAQSLPFGDGRFDAALSTWTLCTVPDPAAALREVRRVLRPGGLFHFVEHGLSPDRNVSRWQHRANPVQRRLGGGCNLDRDIRAIVEDAGFTIVSLDTYYEKRAPKALGYMYEGRARA